MNNNDRHMQRNGLLLFPTLLVHPSDFHRFPPDSPTRGWRLCLQRDQTARGLTHSGLERPRYFYSGRCICSVFTSTFLLFTLSKIPDILRRNMCDVYRMSSITDA